MRHLHRIVAKYADSAEMLSELRDYRQTLRELRQEFVSNQNSLRSPVADKHAKKLEKLFSAYEQVRRSLLELFDCSQKQ